MPTQDIRKDAIITEKRGLYTCPIGTFPCYNNSTCVPQRNVCNFYKDCEDGDDEDPALCSDLSGSVNMIMRTLKKSYQQKLDYQKFYPICDLKEYPNGCVCILQFRVVCKNMNFTKIPPFISSNVTHLILANNTIEEIDTTSMSNYNLKVLHLEGNAVKNIPPEVFSKQTNLERLFLTRNKLTIIRNDTFNGLFNLLWLFLNHNNLQSLEMKAFQDLYSLEWLDLSHNELTLDEMQFPALGHLLELFLDHNRITEIKESTFSKLHNLELLSLKNNAISFINVNAFKRLRNLRELNLFSNNLKELSSELFSTFSLLGSLYLGNNPLHYIPNHLFDNLKNLESLNLEGIEIRNIDVSIFSSLKRLKSIYFKKYFYCTFAPLVKRCRPLSDGISSVDELLAKPILRYALWITCLFTCVGNAMVVCGRVMFRDENKVLNLVIRNLAVSDFLMGIYMIIIAFHDFKFRNIYNKTAHIWMSSWFCTVAGVLAMISSEVSVFLLVFMSVERLLIIAVPFGPFSSMDLTKTMTILSSIWVLGIGLAVFPILQYYSSTRFYGLNGLCVPLYITEPFFVGWKYSAFIILGINFISLVIIAVVYSVMFISIAKTRNATTLPIKDYEFAVRFFFIVLTNGCCWFPIILVKCLVYSETDIPNDLYAWLVVFVLPINSAINPILYTFTTSKYRSKLQKVHTMLQWILRNEESNLKKNHRHPPVPSSAGAILNSSSL
ncbi:hypothetical protein RN001_015830 [Aquatica leii]|uniref:G-protein coupled receptors family 1 profile domain-containing protein n=1 Tax=Aquatica leii TaxID=1421715 RepID=A0AAN7NYJ3_9COLE|nr:hypothetical protein RN001_015830 [Aquatica leii]